MAKKQAAAKAAPRVEVEQPEVKATNKMVEVVIEKPQPKRPEWEIKDRIYYLKGRKKPLSKIIKSSNLYYFDKDKGYEREIKYCENQRTPFVDEMKGDQRLSHIIFRSGSLFVPKEKTVLQKFLSLYHPHKENIFYEHKPVQIAEDQLDWLEFEVQALMIAKDMDIDIAEAIMRVEVGSKVNELSSKELKRDLLLFAKKNPKLFLELTTDDNVMLRNFGIKAAELGIIKLSSDQRHFIWGSNDRKIMTIPFDEHPYSALAAWFKTDEGMEIYSNIEKRLK
jgi:hypothetical protein|tara:strand:+ start:338 stop:1177 length:840 start_codon:yes stop_codon:yes gene_type:complete